MALSRPLTHAATIRPFQPYGRLHVGIPVPERLTRDEIIACERFSLAVWGVTLFDHEPSHNGRHGHTCTLCSHVLSARDAERSRVIRQPWERAAS